MCRCASWFAPPERSSLLWALAELDVRDRTLLVQKILDRSGRRGDLWSFFLNHAYIGTVYTIHTWGRGKTLIYIYIYVHCVKTRRPVKIRRNEDPRRHEDTKVFKASSRHQASGLRGFKLSPRSSRLQVFKTSGRRPEFKRIRTVTTTLREDIPCMHMLCRG